MSPYAGAGTIDGTTGSPPVTHVDVMNALNDYRAAEAAMLRRTRSLRGRGATDALALRYIQDAARAGEVIRPSELAHRLSLSSASVTALVDRLVNSGVAVREPHPFDRRASILRYAEPSEEQAMNDLDQAMRPVADALASLDSQELATVLDFLGRMHAAVDAVARL